MAARVGFVTLERQNVTILLDWASLENLTGSMNCAFLPSKSSWVTPRATEQAPQTWMGIPFETVSASSSEKSGNPTGCTPLEMSSFIR